MRGSYNERYELDEKDVIQSLWRAYQRTSEYRIGGRIHSINSTHPLVRAAEEQGLAKLIRDFIGRLSTTPDLRLSFQNRREGDWIAEWENMHDTLFKHVYRKRGKIRRKGHDVRFGNPGDEELYRIPIGGPATYQGIYEVGGLIKDVLPRVDTKNIQHVCEFLARVHFEFIRVHPFGDGNGRIARTTTDQLAVALGYVPIIAGFPRTNKSKKEAYHAAIRGCIGQPNYYTLSEWIRAQIEDKLREIA